jgi:hypothetical protein
VFVVLLLCLMLRLLLVQLVLLMLVLLVLLVLFARSGIGSGGAARRRVVVAVAGAVVVVLHAVGAQHDGRRPTAPRHAPHRKVGACRGRRHRNLRRVVVVLVVVVMGGGGGGVVVIGVRVAGATVVVVVVVGVPIFVATAQQHCRPRALHTLGQGESRVYASRVVVQLHTTAVPCSSASASASA